MRLNKYISLNIFSLIGYIILILMFFVFCLQIVFNKLYINFELFMSLYSLLLYISILVLLVFIIEKYTRKKYPLLLSKINIKNAICRNIHIFLFYFGFYFSLLNLIIFVFILLIVLKI